MLKIFTGYSRDGLDFAVRDAEKDMEAFMATHPAAIKQVSTNACVDIVESISYCWFTITVLLEERPTDHDYWSAYTKGLAR